MELLNLCNFLRQKKRGRVGGGVATSQQLWWEILSALCLFCLSILLTAYSTKQTNSSFLMKVGSIRSHNVLELTHVPWRPSCNVSLSEWGAIYRFPWGNSNIDVPYFLNIFPILAMFEGMSALIYLLLPGATGAIWAEGARLRQTSIWKHLC